LAGDFDLPIRHKSQIRSSFILLFQQFISDFTFKSTWNFIYNSSSLYKRIFEKFHHLTKIENFDKLAIFTYLLARTSIPYFS